MHEYAAAHLHAHAHPADADRIADLTRVRFGLSAGTRVAVHEEVSDEPGVPLGTRVAFWAPPGHRHEFIVFKPAAAVAEADLPPAFLKPGLVADTDKPCC